MKARGSWISRKNLAKALRRARGMGLDNFAVIELFQEVLASRWAARLPPVAAPPKSESGPPLRPKKLKQYEIVQRPDVVALLGKQSDATVAARFGVPDAAVAAKRRALGIKIWKPLPAEKKAKAPKTRTRLSPEHVLILGTMTDFAASRIIGCSPYTVSIERRKRDIPAFNQDYAWTPDQDAQLGTDFDRVIAKRLGVSKAMVVSRRALLEIPPKGVKAELRPEHVALLGKVADLKLAKMARCSSQTIALMRERAGIPPAFPKNQPTRKVAP